MTESEAPASVEYWKEQFGFVSGSVLVSGIALLKIWPYVAMFQTGLQIHFWSEQRELLTPGYYWFMILTVVLALGISSVVFSLVHIIYRGIWLGLLPYQSRDARIESFQNWLRTRANRWYISVLFIWSLSVAPLITSIGFLLATAIHLWLRALLSSSSIWIGVLAGVVGAISLVLMWILIAHFTDRAPHKGVIEGFRDRWKTMIPALVVVAVSWCLAQEMCYTVDVWLDKTLMSRSKAEYTEISVRLGGATSDSTHASLELKDENGKTVRKLDLVPLGQGSYVSYVSSTELPGKLYRVVLTYPRYVFSFSYPFFQRKIQRSASVVIVS